MTHAVHFTLNSGTREIFSQHRTQPSPSPYHLSSLMKRKQGHKLNFLRWWFKRWISTRLSSAHERMFVFFIPAVKEEVAEQRLSFHVSEVNCTLLLRWKQNIASLGFLKGSKSGCVRVCVRGRERSCLFSVMCKSFSYREALAFGLS